MKNSKSKIFLQKVLDKNKPERKERPKLGTLRSLRFCGEISYCLAEE